MCWAGMVAELAEGSWIMFVVWNHGLSPWKMMSSNADDDGDDDDDETNVDDDEAENDDDDVD
eukprot:1943707-Pyramimonas_sp.AAC.1